MFIHLYLDEFEKIKPTENCKYNIIDTTYLPQGAIIHCCAEVKNKNDLLIKERHGRTKTPQDLITKQGFYTVANWVYV